jgi:hypothetical protein
VWIYRLRGAEPRVKFISRVLLADTGAQVKAGKFGITAGAETAVIDNGTKPSRSYWSVAVRNEHSHTRIRSWSPDRIEIQVDSSQPGVLVLHESYYPGWIAEVDGQPARILRADVLFRAVEVGEGRHLVVFRFAPFAVANLRDALAGVMRGAH